MKRSSFNEEQIVLSLKLAGSGSLRSGPRSILEMAPGMSGRSVAAVPDQAIARHGEPKRWDECPNAKQSMSIEDAGSKIEAWRVGCNLQRPHSSCSHLAPGNYLKRSGAEDTKLDCPGSRWAQRGTDSARCAYSIPARGEVREGEVRLGGKVGRLSRVCSPVPNFSPRLS